MQMEMDVTGCCAVRNHGDWQRGCVRWVLHDLDIQDGSQTTKTLCTDP